MRAGIDFGRVYAAYGGVFIILSVPWGWVLDGVKPHAATVMGGVFYLIGVVVIMYWPQRG